MITTVLERIESIRTRNQLNIKAINKHLYKLIYNPELLIIASKSHKVILNKSKTNVEKDESSIIKKTSISLKNQSFRFNIKEIQNIKNNNKKLSFTESFDKNKTIQSVIILVLEAIYDPIFSLYNKSFQKQYCYQEALKELKTQWTNVIWILEGNIESNYKNIEQKNLVKILRKKIQDEKFIQLIWKLIRIPIKINGILYVSKKGISSNNLLSSLLLNIYLNEFDIFLEELCIKSNTKPQKKVFYNKKIFKITSDHVERFTNKNRNAVSKFFEQNDRKIRKLQNTQTFGSFINNGKLSCQKIKFIRYENTWKFGVKGSKTLSKNLKKIIEIFINSIFELTRSFKKINLIYFPKAKVEFLGYLLTTRKIFFPSEDSKITKQKNGIKINFYIPTHNIIKKLSQQNFCTKSGKGMTKKGWIIYPDELIIKKYKNLLKNLQTYYSFGKNYQSSLNRLNYILKFSCAHTLASKHRSSLSRQIKILNDIRFKTRSREESNKESYKMGIQIMEQNFLSEPRKINILSSNVCFICNKTKKLEIHHIKKLARTTIEFQNKTINLLIKKINKKQVCLCPLCHFNISKTDLMPKNRDKNT